MPTPGTAVEIRQDEILTGEAVALDVQPIGFFLRAVGALIDVLAAIVILALMWQVAGWVLGGGVDLFALSPIIMIATLVLVLVVLPTVVETATRGRSLGKLAVGGRVVRIDGGAAGFRHAFIRALVGVLEIWFTVGAIAGIVGAFTPRSQRLGDLLAGTYAERTRAPRLPPPAGGVPAALAEWATVADVARLPDRTARRVTQFVRQAERMAAPSRHRAAIALAAEVSPYVSPSPTVDPETLLRGVVAVRRDREFAGVTQETARVDALLTGVADAPRGFPRR